jgi:hypothetical protein
MTARAAETAAIAALAVVVTLIVAAPVLQAPSDRIFGMETVGRHHDPFTVMEQFSRPIADMATKPYSQPLTDIPGALLARASGPVAAYNWLVLLTFPLSAVAAYWLARYLTLSPAGAAIAAIAFAFSPFHVAHAAYHAHIAQTQWIPLYFLSLWCCLDDSRPATIALLAISMAGVTLSNFYGGLIAAVITPVAVATHWYFRGPGRPRPLRSLAITTATLALVAGGGILYAYYAAHAVLTSPAAFAVPRRDLFRYSAKWWAYLVPAVGHPLLGGIAERFWNGAGVQAGLLEQQVTLGWGVVILGLVAIVASLRRHREPASLPFVPMLAIVALAALVCSLSPERAIGPFTFTRPSALLYRLVPMFRSYARFGVVVQLMAALLAGIGAERLWRSGTRRARFACVALVALAAGEYAVWPAALSRDVLPTLAHRWVVQQPQGLAVLDCAPFTQESESIQWLSGYRISLAAGDVGDCTEPHFVDKLSAVGYTHLLVRRDTAAGRWFASQPALEGLGHAARFPDADVFTVTARRPAIYTAAMHAFYPREYDETWTWRWMGPPASWKIVNRTDRSIAGTAVVEIAAFAAPRRLRLSLDGLAVQTLVVGAQRSVSRVGPLTLSPGDHELVFSPSEAPTVADEIVHNGDRRPLSFAVGGWNWTIGTAPDDRR